MKKTVSLGFALILAAMLAVPVLAPAQPKAAPKPATAKATFAGGCFWCMEEVYDKVPGVISTVFRLHGRTDQESDLRAGLRPAAPGTPRSCRSSTIPPR